MSDQRLLQVGIVFLAVFSGSALAENWPQGAGPNFDFTATATAVPNLLAINDVGPLGDSFTRSSVTTDGKRMYAHTIREVIAFE